MQSTSFSRQLMRVVLVGLLSTYAVDGFSKGFIKIGGFSTIGTVCLEGVCVNNYKFTEADVWSSDHDDEVFNGIIGFSWHPTDLNLFQHLYEDKKGARVSHP